MNDKYNFTWPVPDYKRISSYFGYRDTTGLPTGSTAYHDAIDISANLGSNVLAAFDGVIKSTSNSKYRGNYIVIEHDNGISTEYAHLNDISVNAGDFVKAGSIIGHVGSTGASTGAHLDFKIKENGTAVDPLTFKGISGSDDINNKTGGDSVSFKAFIQALKTHWLLVAAGLLITAIVTK